MEKIYVLKCEKKKYYVGKTSNIDRRFAEHLDGEFGSEWTRYYAPQQIIAVEPVTSDFDEMKKTLEYMKKYGVDHVRGAQWSNITLTPKQRTEIMRAINTNGCFHCGQTGHYANDCPNRNQSSQAVQCFQCGKYGHFANDCRKRNQSSRTVQCFRCGKYGHYATECYATQDIDGRMLDCARCGRDSHSADECFANTHIKRRRLH